MKVLIAGVGNIFLTDDDSVLRSCGPGPDGGCRTGSAPSTSGSVACNLAYELLEGYDAVVLVDVAPAGPGTVCLLQVDPDAVGTPEDGPLLDAHGMEPVAVLRTLGSLGGRVDRVYVLACEPADTEEGLGLTPAVAAAVPAAVEALLRLVDQLVEQAVSALNSNHCEGGDNVIIWPDLGHPVLAFLGADEESDREADQRLHENSVPPPRDARGGPPRTDHISRISR